MDYEKIANDLLTPAGIVLNGTDPWDIQVAPGSLKELVTRILARGELGFCEAYMDGLWQSERPAELVRRLIVAGAENKIPLTWPVISLAIRSRLFNRQNRSGAKEVATTHYDIPPEIMHATYCDRRVTGSCAYDWEHARTIDEAQEAKLDLICRKIGLRSGMKVLDIGCGWGSFMGFAVEERHARCTGVTVSQEQVNFIKRRYGKNWPITAIKQDYRDLSGQFDRVVSVGMFEHVGSKNYREYFEVVHRCLREDGLFLLHTIIGSAKNRHTVPSLDKYIFPNGELPTVGQIARAVEGLFIIENVENFGYYYARTLAEWRKHFNQVWPTVEEKWNDIVNRSTMPPVLRMPAEQFHRLWNYYLFGCEGAFLSRQIGLGQFVLSPKGVDGVWKMAA